MRLELTSLGVPYQKVPGIRLRVASSATHTPLRRVVSPPNAQSGERRAIPRNDPFRTSEGLQHHRSPRRLAERVVQLEQELEAKSNANSALADENAKLKAQGEELATAINVGLEALPFVDVAKVYAAINRWNARR